MTVCRCDPADGQRGGKVIAGFRGWAHAEPDAFERRDENGDMPDIPVVVDSLWRSMLLPLSQAHRCFDDETWHFIAQHA